MVTFEGGGGSAYPLLGNDPLIYYKSKKTCEFVFRDNIHSQLLTRNQYNVAYEFTCYFEEFKSLQNSYTGMKTRTLTERLSEHRYKGSIYKRLMEVHGYRPALDEIIKSYKILCRVQTRKDIHIFKALHIYSKKPTPNDNSSNFDSLKLFNRRITR